MTEQAATAATTHAAELRRRRLVTRALEILGADIDRSDPDEEIDLADIAAGVTTLVRVDLAERAATALRALFDRAALIELPPPTLAALAELCIPAVDAAGTPATLDELAADVVVGIADMVEAGEGQRACELLEVLLDVGLLNQAAP